MRQEALSEMQILDQHHQELYKNNRKSDYQ